MQHRRSYLPLTLFLKSAADPVCCSLIAKPSLIAWELIRTEQLAIMAGQGLEKPDLVEDVPTQGVDLGDL